MRALALLLPSLVLAGCIETGLTARTSPLVHRDDDGWVEPDGSEDAPRYECGSGELLDGWPPNHKMGEAEVILGACLAELWGVQPELQWVHLLANQADDGNGDGNTRDDLGGGGDFIDITDAFDWDPELSAWTGIIDVRVERAADVGDRLYAIEAYVTAPPDHRAVLLADIAVPLNNSGR